MEPSAGGENERHRYTEVMSQHIDQDQCLRLLHVLDWSLGETSWRYPDGSGYWQWSTALQNLQPDR